MNAVQELQNRLASIIYRISDVASLREIESAVDGLAPSIDAESVVVEIPWRKAVLTMKTLPSFEKVVDDQGGKKLTFAALYPYIDESDETCDVYDLLAALN
jgi:hypothetical protein